MKPSVVLFDLGNVLVRIHPEAFLQTLGIDTPENRRRYQLKIIRIVQQYERGADSTELYLDRLKALFDGQFQPDDLRRAMLSVIGQPIERMESLVRRVASSFQTGMLSNTNPVHYEYCLKAIPAVQHLPRHFLSYQLKCLKPEPLIYEKTVGLLQLPSSEMLFIDDVAENVEGARNAGLMALQFTSSEELEKSLTQLNVL